MSDELDDYIGELMVAGPSLFHWRDDAEPQQAYLNLDHVVGCQITPAIDAEDAQSPRTMHVVLSTGVVNVTTNQEQIDRFMDQWVIT